MNEHEILQSFWHNSDGTWTPWSAPSHERPKGDVRVESVRLPTADIDRRGP
jgi:hypothetical protein